MGIAALFLSLLVVVGCGRAEPAATPVSAEREPVQPDPAPNYGQLSRLDFNRLAIQRNLALFWAADTNGNHAVDPGEIATPLFYPPAPAWAAAGHFTPEFDEAYRSMLAERDAAAPADPAEAARIALVRADLDQGLSSLVYHDFRGLSVWEKAFVRHVVLLSQAVDQLYETQLGLDGLADRIQAADTASRSLLRRNRGPHCESPLTEANPACTAIKGLPRAKVSVYPLSAQHDGFCAELEARPDASALLSPFTVVREGASRLESVGYDVAYAERMRAIATELRATAAEIPETTERALHAYLLAAAQSFEDNDWTRADEAWAAMNAENSAWYLRIAPDETYWEPCSRKAGFHVTFARIDRASLGWQARLLPLQQELERRIAALAGRDYRARTVTFHLPDFIDIILNAGDDRGAFGATVGQSLPNWGPVADQGRGRTVAMSNLYTDEDSNRLRRERIATIVTPQTLAQLTDMVDAGLLATILHEATHNLGPASGHRYRGKSDEEAFGGELASMLEELKAQSGALFLLALLVDRGVIDEATERQSYLDSIFWSLGHISRGMFTPDGHVRAYSQLSAVQIGFLIEQGAVRFDAQAMPASGAEPGAFSVDFTRMRAASRAMMSAVARIKASNDRAAAEELVRRYVTSDLLPQHLIADRYNRFPKQSFLYAFDMGDAT